MKTNCAMPYPAKIFAFAALIFANLSADAQWRELYKGTNYNDNIKGVSFITPSTGFVAFTDFIGYTTDSGRTYIKRYIQYANIDFNGYIGVNLTFGFSPSGIKTFSTDSMLVYGDFGTEPSILFSANQGVSWRLVYHEPYNINAPVLNEGITDMEFPGNTAIGYAVHHERVLKTTDRGQTWNTIFNAPNQQLKKLSFPSIYTGMVTGQNKVYKTVNGGVSWVLLSPDPVSSNPVYDNVFFTTTLNGYITQSFGGKVLNTTDGGTTWKQMNDSALTPVSGSDMYFINDSTGFLTAGYGYEVYRTSDSGKIWEQCLRNTSYQYLYYGLNTISFLNDNKTGWAGGDGEYLMITTNAAIQTLPKAYFKIDTNGVSKTGFVNLINYSRKIYSYKWTVNKQVISTDYNAGYTHNIYTAIDTIQLIVSNGIYSDTAISYAFFNAQQPPPPVIGWSVKHTNITDNLQDVRFFGNAGLIIGSKGLYYTLTGAEDLTGWKKFTKASSAADSLLLQRIKFTGLAFGDKEPVFYACGNDTVNNKAVIVQIDLTALTCTFVYKGNAGTHLNAIVFIEPAYYFYKGNVLAVGNGGLEVLYNTDGLTVTESYLSDKRNLIGIFKRRTYTDAQNVGIVSDSVLYITDLSGNLTFAKQLGTKAIAGTSGGGNYNDQIISTTTLHYYLDGDGYFVSDSITNVKPVNVTYKCINTGNLYNSGIVYVGTNVGIYRVVGYAIDQTINGLQAIEYMPTSNRLPINKIWFKQLEGFDTGYAVSDNGVLLETGNFGGPDVPYSKINTIGNCLGDGTYFTGLHGSGNSCAWYIDNAYIGNNCSDFTTTIATPGAHKLTYIVSNDYQLADTSIKTIYINPPPATNLTYEVSDTILCKAESILIRLSNAQAGFKYELIKDGTDSSFGSVASNGGNLYFTSDSISQTGDYYLRVTSTNSGCSRNFDHKTHIVVEHTKSAFTADLYNAALNENINFYNHSKEASSYKWLFSSGASIDSSTLANVANVYYTSAGSKTISLISKSINGCSDTLTTNAVYVYQKPQPDATCFAYPSLDNNPNRGVSSLSKLCLTNDNGYIITAEGSAPVVQSRYGVSHTISTSNTYIPYLAKYSTDGALKWSVYSPSGGNFFSAAVDESGNIYVTGGCTSNSYIYFSNGDSARIINDTTQYNFIGFLLKLTSSGKLIWATTFAGPFPVDFESYYVQGGLGSKIAVKNNTILLTGSFDANLSYTKDGNTQSLIALSPCGNCSYQNNFILKLKDDGTVIWYAWVENNSVNQLFNISGAGLDKNGNAYISGFYEGEVIFHSHNLTTASLPGNVGYAKGYLLQFDNNGNLKWDVDMQNADVETDALVTDDQGNSYITGSSGNNVTIVSGDGSQNILAAATYFLMKFSNTGKYTWGVGSQSDYVSYTYALSLKNNDLFTGGSISKRDTHSADFDFTSTSGNPLSITLTESEFFVAQYTTNGVLKRVVRSGASPGGDMYPGDIALDSKNNFIISGTLDDENGGTGTITIFKNNIVAPNANDFIVKTDSDFCASKVLPVNLLSFDGYLNNSQVLLNWKTEDEINVDQYLVQRSSDGKNFSVIGTVTAHNGHIQNAYSFTDDLSGLNTGTGIIYYRLKIKDRDGKINYSNVIPIKLATYSISIYPNPNKGAFTLEIYSGNQPRKYEIGISDAAGKILSAKSITHEMMSVSEHYNLSLSAGIYFIKINDGINETIKKLVITK